MGVNRGRNAGLTGLVDLPGLGGKFEARLYGWKPRLTGATRPRRGRGGGLFRSVRWLFSAGTIAASGKVRLDGWPSPDQWKGQTGTITVTLDGHRRPDLLGLARHAAQRHRPDPADQEQYEGTSKSLDPQGLASASTRLIDIWGDLATPTPPRPTSSPASSPRPWRRWPG
jgi:hypothetical protein